MPVECIEMVRVLAAGRDVGDCFLFEFRTGFHFFSHESRRPVPLTQAAHRWWGTATDLGTASNRYRTKERRVNSFFEKCYPVLPNSL